MISGEDIEAFIEEWEKARNPPQKVSEMVEEFASVMGQPKDPVMSWYLVQEEYLELGSEMEPYPGCRERILKEMSDLVYVLYGLARSLDLPLDEALRRVHKNNMERCVWPDGSVKRREDGKILKRPDAKPVDLGDLV